MNSLKNFKKILGVVLAHVFIYISYYIHVNCEYGNTDFFDPTSLLSKEYVNDSLVDLWKDPSDLLISNQDNPFAELLTNSSISPLDSLFPLTPFNSISDEILIRCINAEGIVYSPDECPNLDCERAPSSDDYKYFNSSSSSTIRVASSNESVILGLAIYTFETSIIPSINLINKFVVNFKIKDPEKICKASIRLVTLSRRNDSPIPVLRGSSFLSLEFNVVPNKTFYTVDLIGLFATLPNEFDLTKISIAVLPSTPSMNINLETSIYSVIRFYSNVESIPFYNFGGIGERAMQQNKLIQVRTTSIFGRSIIDPDDSNKARFNDYCPKVIGGQCLVQITSLGSTSAIGIFGFQLSLAGLIFSLKRVKIYIPISVYKNSGESTTDIYVSLLKPTFSITKLNYEEFKNSYQNPINTIKVPFSLEHGMKTLIVDITKLFNGISDLKIENVIIGISLPKYIFGAIFAVNKAKLTYQYDPSLTFQAMQHLNSTTFQNRNIASINISYFDKNGLAISDSINADAIIANNFTTNNSAFISQFSLPFITTQSLTAMNLTIIEKSNTAVSYDIYIDKSTNSSEYTFSNATNDKLLNENDNLPTHQTIDYILNIINPIEISSVKNVNELEVVSKFDFKLIIGGKTTINIIDIFKQAIKNKQFNLSLISLLISPKGATYKNLSFSLPFLELSWNAGLALFDGTIGGGTFQILLKNSQLGQLTRTNWSSSATTVESKLNYIALFMFDFSKIACLKTINYAHANIELSKFTANGEFHIFLMDLFNWDSSFQVESQNFFNNPVKYTYDQSTPPTLLPIPFVVDRKSTLSIDISLTNILGYGALSHLVNPKKGVIAISTDSDDSEAVFKSMEIDIKCSLNDGVYYNTAIV